MNIAGVVVEYNPFHNGHLYHLNATRSLTKADIVIAVMSGPFLQRGEPALVSKWDRAHMALLHGADLVLELPYVYAVQHAEIFAFGAVSILNTIGCTHLCFGSEEGDINPFLQTLELLKKEHLSYNTKINQYIKTGVSYPKAQAMAFESLGLPQSETVDLVLPNNILGFNYVKAADKLDANMVLATIPRKQANYHDEDFNSSSIASATSIRKALFSGGNTIDTIQSKLPLAAYNILKNRHPYFINWETGFPYLKYRLLTASPPELSKIYEMEEGLENRFIREIQQKTSFTDFMTAIKTKRYTWTRLQRLCTHVLTNTTKTEMQPVLDREPVSYLRLLGMNQKGRDYLNDYKKKLTVPLYTKRVKDLVPLAELDFRADEVFGFLMQSANPNASSMENTRHPILI